jgi:hypothetical protein
MAFLYEDDEPEPTPLPSAEEVEAGVAEWKTRIDALFRDIAAWLPDGCVADTSQSYQVEERMMEIRGIPPYTIPVLNILCDGRRVMSFRPDARWVFHTRGRVMISGANRPARLLDVGEAPGDVRWMLYDPSNWSKGGDPFMREALSSLFGDRA